MNKLIELSAEQMTNKDAVSEILKEQGVITTISMDFKGSERSGDAVDGKSLLAAMGIAHTQRDITTKLQRVIKLNSLVLDTDYIKIHPSKIHAAVNGCIEKVSHKAITYVFTTDAAIEAILSAQTAKGKTARKGIIEKVVAQSVAIEVKDTALTAIQETTNEEHIQELASAGLTGSMQDVMLMARPARRLAKMLELDDGVSLPVKVEEILTASYNNVRATYDDRVRTAQSLRETVKKYAEAYIIKNVSNGMKLNTMINERSEADNLILKYEKKLARRAKTLAENKLIEA